MSVTLSLVAFVVSSGAAPQEPGAPVTDERPNLVLVLADDVGYGDLGCYGHEVLRTPHLDRMASEGLRLGAMYAGAPNCSPSRASLLTGRAAMRVGFYDYLSPKFPTDMRLLESEVTLAELLRGAGYTTFHGGKWHLSPDEGSRPALAHGFDESVPAVTATRLVERFGAWLDARDATAPPFFAYLALWECHEPLASRSPPALRAPYAGRAGEPGARGRGGRSRRGDRGLYFGCVAQMDAAIGQLLDRLEATGLEERTLVLFTSDNGPLRGTPDSWGSKGAFRGSKGDLYEGGLRVPGIVRFPGRVPAGRVSDEPVHFWDVLPTFCELAGVTLPEGLRVDGASLLPLFTAGASATVARETPLFWSCAGSRGSQVALREGRWKLLAGFEPIRVQESVLEHLRGSSLVGFELYHLGEDPSERAERSARDPEVFARLRARLEALHRDVLAEAPTFDLESYRARMEIMLREGRRRGGSVGTEER